MGSDKPIDVNLHSELSIIKINVDKNFVSFFMSAVNSLLWCFQYSDIQKKKKLNDSTPPNDANNINNNDVIDDGSYTSSDDDDDDDDDDFFDDDDDVTGNAIMRNDGSVDESAINAKDEYLNKLKKEYSQGEVEGQSDDLFGLSELPVIRTTLKLDQFEFNMEGVAKMGVHKVVVCSLIEAESKGDEGNNTNNNSGGINIMDSLLTSTYTVEFSLGSVNLISMIPSAYTYINTYIHNYVFTFIPFFLQKRCSATLFEFNSIHPNKVNTTLFPLTKKSLPTPLF